MNVMLKLPELMDPSTPPLSGDICLSEARRRSLQRTVQALFRERLLMKEHLIIEGAIAWLPLWAQQGLLRFDGLSIGRIGNCELSGPISWYRTGERPVPIVTASALISCIVNTPAGNFSAKDAQRLMLELDNSVDNDVLCLGYRKQWGQELISDIVASGQPGLLASLRNGAFDNPILLLEQWGTLGHPWHPTFKTKLGLTSQEVFALSPEFRPDISIRLAAVRTDKMCVEMADDQHGYRAWFASAFPRQWQEWQAALQQKNHDSSNWLPIPLHPYQASKLLPDMFAPEIERGELVLLDGIDFSASPTMSFRTVVPERSTTLPHLKLPVSLRLTSVQRTVSPKSAVMGPRLTRLLSGMLAREHGFEGTLDIVGEGIGLHYLDPDHNDDRSRHLSVLFRSNPASKISEDLFPVPVGALFADTPVNGRPLITELVSLSHGDHAAGALRFFSQYTATALTAVLGPYLLYGVAFEAHQQNSFIMVNRDWQPARLLVRDFGDLRIHQATLRQAGMDLQAYRAGHTLFDSNDPVRDKFIHAILLCHLSEVAILLARTYQQPESAFWDIFRQQLEQAFDHLQDRTEPQRWQTEKQYLLHAPWPAKEFLRMRLMNTSDDMHGTMPNPLSNGAGL